MTIHSLSISLALFFSVASIPDCTDAFTARHIYVSPAQKPRLFASSKDDAANQNDVLAAAIDAMYGGGSEMREEPAVTRARIEELVETNNVLLFMKGSKFFPQCGFSDTATKIIETFNVEYETVDVLEDDAIREGVKIYSQWPTIPQLYVGGEFIGGSDIMMEMYEDGSLKAMLEDVVKKE